MPLYPEKVTSEITHEFVEETGRLPVYINTPVRDECRDHGCCSSLTIPLHWHEYVEIIRSYQDDFQATIQNETYKMKQGDLLIINSEELHSTRIPSLPSQYFLMQISARRMREFCPDFDRRRFDNYIPAEELEKLPRLKEMLDDMESLYNENEDGYELLFTSRLYEFIYLLVKNRSHDISPVSVDTTTGRDKKRIADIIEWTQAHCREMLTLDDVAQHVGISREYFCRIFKKYTGQTYLEFLCSIRTMNFYNQLGSSDEPIPILMEQNGLTNYKTFIRTFKDMYGTTPQKARQSMTG